MAITAARLFLVIDTCVLLSHLDYLAALTAQWPPQQQLEFTIVIPDVVRVAQLCPPPPPQTPWDTPYLSAHAYRMLIGGACNPMLRPIHVS